MDPVFIKKIIKLSLDRKTEDFVAPEFKNTNYLKNEWAYFGSNCKINKCICNKITQSNNYYFNIYIMKIIIVCDMCKNKFKFNKDNNVEFGMERIMHAFIFGYSHKLNIKK